MIACSDTLTKFGSLAALAIAVASPDASAAPPCPAEPVHVAETAQAAVNAFAAMDAAGFDQTRSNLGEQVGCLSAPLDGRQAAAVHLVEALAAFKAKDGARTVAELQAAHDADPSFELPRGLAPSGGLLQSKEVAALARPATARTPHGLALNVFVDGRAAPDLPVDWPAVVVVVGASGAPLWSGVVVPGTSIPNLALPDPGEVIIEPAGLAIEPVASSSPVVEAAGHEKTLVRPALYAAAGMGVVAGVLTGLYFPARDRVNTASVLLAQDADEEAWDDAFGAKLSAEEVEVLRARARTYEVGAQVSGGLFLGLGVVGLVLAW